MTDDKKDEKKHSHDNLHSPRIECEECGGEVNTVRANYPRAYECVCKDCGHSFVWAETKERWKRTESTGRD